MRKKAMSILLAAVLALGILPIPASRAVTYTDVPAAHWAYQTISAATEAGMIKGTGGGKFGLGTNVKRCEFVTMVNRVFGWTKVSTASPTFSDNADKSKWYYTEIETAVANGAVKKDSQTFRPEAYITREEMAVMLVCALGYDNLADQVKDFGLPFTDVGRLQGYITIARDLGIINGKNDTVFDPSGKALREEAAAMILRVYQKYNVKISFLHGFYAISSWQQKELVAKMDGISLGWSRMEYSEAGGLALNTTSEGKNSWNIPAGYSMAVDYFRENNLPSNLGAFMSTAQTLTLADGSASNACREILLSPEVRTKAVSAIIAELTKAYPEGNFYSGVTIDFENMKGAELKTGFTAFLTELRGELNKTGKPLYVAVHPMMKNGGASFDAYDYRAIGNLADKVILMAHDYQANTLTANEMAAGYTTTPVTPFADVYFALRAVTDAKTGVSDRNKIVLALSFASAGWSLQNGKVINASSMKPTPAELYNRLIDAGTTLNYSARYRNPYITYYDESDRTQNIVWYEDSRSVSDKIKLARMFGINGISVWRLGIVPDYQNPSSSREIYYNVWSSILSQR